MKIKRYAQSKATLDMTPVIDIVFQLLLFFMIASVYIKTSAINVNLPEAATSDAQPNREAVVTLYKNSAMTLNDTAVTKQNLGKLIKDMYIADKTLVVTIRGDSGVSYGELIDVMDIIRLTGIKKISLATKQKDAP